MACVGANPFAFFSSDGVGCLKRRHAIAPGKVSFDVDL